MSSIAAGVPVSSECKRPSVQGGGIVISGASTEATIASSNIYGNIAPKTMWGRLVCIAYATLGIPIMLLCLTNLGEVMADIFRFVYDTVCCCKCCRRDDFDEVGLSLI